MANTPLLTTHWQHHDLPTQKLIHALWDAIDSRKRGASDYKSAHAVLAGIFALRHEETFAVNKRSLTRAEGRSWDLIQERHMGSLLRRSSGKNRYSLSPEFTAATSVVESNDATLLMRVEGRGSRRQIYNTKWDTYSLVCNAYEWAANNACLCPRPRHYI